jgi:hypothetical protein
MMAKHQNLAKDPANTLLHVEEELDEGLELLEALYMAVSDLRDEESAPLHAFMNVIAGKLKQTRDTLSAYRTEGAEAANV